VQRLAKVHEAAMVKQQEIHQKSLSSHEQKAKRTQENTALAENPDKFVSLKLDSKPYNSNIDKWSVILKN
jgi:hypothetical protein